MANVTFDGVTKRYGAITAVEGLDLAVEDGEFIVLLGPSGCGKSTALRMIAGLEDISDGELSIGDRVVNHVVPAKRDVAMVFQSYALYPHMTVRKNIESPLVSKPSRIDDGSVRKLTKAERDERIDEAARMLGLADYLDRKPSALSGGQRQRVALARAVVSRPAVFLLDEPLSNLDAKLRAQTRAELTALHARLATTMVYVTHDQVEAMTMADRVAVLADGHIQQVGTPREVYEAPANVFVAGFIGTPPMNTAPGTAGGGKVELEGGHLTIDDTSLTGDVIVGARPEHLLVHPDGPLCTIVRNVEWLGHEALATVGLGAGTDGPRWTVRLEPSGAPPSEGDELRVRPVDGHVHLFDASTGWRLGLPGAADAAPSPASPETEAASPDAALAGRSTADTPSNPAP